MINGESKSITIVLLLIASISYCNWLNIIDAKRHGKLSSTQLTFYCFIYDTRQCLSVLAISDLCVLVVRPPKHYDLAIFPASFARFYSILAVHYQPSAEA